MVSQRVGAKILIPVHRQSRPGNHEALALNREESLSVTTDPAPWFSHAQFPFATAALTGRSSLQAARVVEFKAPLHLPKALRRSPPQRSDLVWGKPSPSLSLSHPYLIDLFLKRGLCILITSTAN